MNTNQTEIIKSLFNDVLSVIAEYDGYIFMFNRYFCDRVNMISAICTNLFLHIDNYNEKEVIKQLSDLLYMSKSYKDDYHNIYKKFNIRYREYIILNSLFDKIKETNIDFINTL